MLQAHVCQGGRKKDWIVIVCKKNMQCRCYNFSPNKNHWGISLPTETVQERKLPPCPPSCIGYQVSVTDQVVL